MKLSKLLPVLCGFALSASLIAVRAEDNPAQAAARMALAQRLFTSSANTPATNAPAMKPVSGPDAKAEAKAKQDAAERKAKAEADRKLAGQKAKTESAAKQPTNSKLDAERAALSSASKPATTNAPAASTKPVAKAKKEKKKRSADATKPENSSEANFAGKDLGLMPVPPPPPPISAGKQAQLDQLLTKYKADQVSPDEYQKQRAAILAQP